MDTFAWITLILIIGFAIYLLCYYLMKISRDLGKSEEKNNQYEDALDVQKKYNTIDSSPDRSASDILKLMRKKNSSDVS